MRDEESAFVSLLRDKSVVEAERDVRSAFARGFGRDKLGISDPGLGTNVGLAMAAGVGLGATSRRSGAGLAIADALGDESSTGLAVAAGATRSASADAAGTVRPARYFAVVSGELSAADTIEAAARRNRKLQTGDFKSQTKTHMHREMFKRCELGAGS